MYLDFELGTYYILSGHTMYVYGKHMKRDEPRVMSVLCSTLLGPDLRAAVPAVS